MESSDGTNTISYTYDADGLRTSKTVNGVEHTYYYAGGKLLRETFGSNTLDFFYDSNSNAYALKYNGILYYYITNLQGDVMSIVDAQGAVVASYAYDPYGNLISDEPAENTVGHLNPIRYRGYVYDPESELYYLQSRYYDPEIGRFLNADGFVSTGQGVLGNNMFAYCLGNPTNRTDGEGSVSYDCMDDDPNNDNNPINDVGGGSRRGNSSSTQAAGTKANPFIGGSYQPGQGSGNSGNSNYQPPSGGGGVSSSTTANGVTVDFGHGGRHVEEGYDYLDIESVIAQDVMNFPREIGSAKYVTIVYDSRTLLYGYYTLGPNHISIGTYYFILY